jgi:hypothetical protein
MKPLDKPESFKVYFLVKQSGISLAPVSPYSTVSSVTYGAGFFDSRETAEHHRTLELLRTPLLPSEFIHIFELEIPNPVKDSQ